MKKIGFITLGCKVNIYESNALKNELMKRGFQVGDPTADCDAYIVNTCSVTNMADAKSRKMIHRVAKLNPNAIVCVMGCYSQTSSEAKDVEGIDILVGNGNKLEVISMLEEKLENRFSEKKIKILDILKHKDYEPLEVTTYDHTRAFIKIEDGCENFCTYCIIPYARGPVRSKPMNEVIREITRIVDEGYLEVVLAGIHTGRYEDQGMHLSDLIRRILAEVPQLERLRLSSIEINEVDDAFIELMKNSKVLADHLHLPLQSGSNLVLEKMERRYNLDFFQEKVEKIRKVRPDISLTTDVIVGFPFETEEEFQSSIQFIKKIQFSKLHVFPYSVRKGTKAADFPQIRDEIKKQRTENLLQLSKELEATYAMKFIGKTVEVIVEQCVSDELMMGHTSNYLQVYLPKVEGFLRKRVLVKVERIEEDKIYGSLL